MKCNVGGADRGIRFVLGLILVVLLFVLPEPIRYVGILGFVLIFTALIRWCPLYLPFKINTKKD